MGKRVKYQLPIEALTQRLLEQLQSKCYGKETLDNYRRILMNLEMYVRHDEMSTYTPEIGDNFIADYIFNHEIGIAFQKSIKTAIGRLNDYCEGQAYTTQRKKAPVQLPEKFTVLIEQYILFCEQHGNKIETIKGKRKFCGDFLTFMSSLECSDIKDMDSTHIGKVCLMFENKDAWAVIRMFLKYLYETNMVERDYSPIVPHYKQPFLIPSTYSEDEILRFEKTIDLTSKTGIRDYAMLLLATRLGMRSGDIAQLTFKEIDFENNAIRLIQEKTLQPLELPLLPEIKEAIRNYIENTRPAVNEARIFLRNNAPYQGITTSVLRFATTKYFCKAGIDISSKKHGVHVFRSSLASSMVNGQVPYDVVRKVLGHTDPDAIKHYAKLDIERLREYALPVPEPSGIFKEFLNGGRQL